MTDKPYWRQRWEMKLGRKAESPSGGGQEAQDSANSEKKDHPAKKGAPSGNRPKSPKKPIKARSKKRAKQERQYRPIRRKFLQDHPVCQLGLDGCTNQATEIHHAAGRVGKQLLNVDDFKAACRNCHQKVERNPAMAKEKGASKSRLSK